MGYLAEMQRKLLEQIMGQEAMGLISSDLKFNDAKVCRNFICGMCPHELFTNTRMDLGACQSTHSKKLKDDYETALAAAKRDPKAGDLKHSLAELNSLMAEYERNIFQFVEECDRRIRAAQRRLEKTPEENNKTTALMREIGEIQNAYDAAMAEVEALGEAGQIEESMAENVKADALKVEKQEKERELQALTDSAGASGHQKLRVCDICGAYLSILDSDRRLADHFGGKMHLGYLQLRQMTEAWRARPESEVPKLANSNPPPVSNGYNGAHASSAGGPGAFSRPIDNGYGDRNSRYSSGGHDSRPRESGPPDDRRGADRYAERDRSSRYDGGSRRTGYEDDRERDHKRSRYD